MIKIDRIFRLQDEVNLPSVIFAHTYWLFIYQENAGKNEGNPNEKLPFENFSVNYSPQNSHHRDYISYRRGKHSTADLNQVIEDEESQARSYNRKN